MDTCVRLAEKLETYYVHWGSKKVRYQQARQLLRKRYYTLSKK